MLKMGITEELPDSGILVSESALFAPAASPDVAVSAREGGGQDGCKELNLVGDVGDWGRMAKEQAPKAMFVRSARFDPGKEAERIFR